MTASVSSTSSAPVWRMPPPPRSHESASTGSANTTATSTSTTTTDEQLDAQASGKAPEGFEEFAGKFPNFGGGNMGPGMMPPFGQRETFL